MYIDSHVHLRDFNQTHKETVAHGLEVARDSGVVAVFDMPNTDPPIMTRDLVLDRAEILGANAAGTITVHLGKASTVTTGTAIESINLNPGFANLADVDARKDEAAVADGDTVHVHHVIVTVMTKLELTGIRLSKGTYVQFNQDVESTAGAVTVFGYFE